MFKNLSFGNTNADYNVKDLNTALKRMELAGAFLFTIPGPKMLWQFGELGYDYSIEYGCRVCNKPVRWDYYEVPNRERIYQVWGELIKLKTTYDVFSTNSFSLNVAGFGKRISLNSPTMNVTVLGNFDINMANVIPAFQHVGWWYEYFSGDSLYVNDVNASMTMIPGEYRLYTDVRLSTPEIVDGINDGEIISAQDIQAWPNPTTGEVQLLTALTESSEVRIQIYDQTGGLVHMENLGTRPVGDVLYIWNQQVSPGLYTIQITTNNTTGSIRVLRL